MNERIRELAVQARLYAFGQIGNSQDPTEWSKCHDMFEEKFAELIVRECIGCCEQVISDPVPKSVDTWLNGGSQCIQEIKHHFGVDK